MLALTAIGGRNLAMATWLARIGGGLSLALVAGALIGAEPAAPVASEKPDQPAAAPEPPPLRHGVFRFTSYPAAWTAAQKSNRPILIFATAPSCPHCVRMLGETYKKPAVSQLVRDSFETVYVDRVEQPELASKLQIRWFPSTIVVAPDNKVLDVIEGYVDSATLARRLRTSFAAHQAATKTR
jgi:thioredoxin-like negative regulator of GroEL